MDVKMLDAMDRQLRNRSSLSLHAITRNWKRSTSSLQILLGLFLVSLFAVQPSTLFAQQPTNFYQIPNQKIPLESSFAATGKNKTAPVPTTNVTAKKPTEGRRRYPGSFNNGWYVTNNFQVRAMDERLAAEVGQRAEYYRESLAKKWLGRTLPAWKQRCPIQVEVNGRAQGETSFLLPSSGTGMPTDWDMKIFGPVDRLLDSVLPHEVTHTIFATHFGRKLPRWADEGACTTVEHPAEKQKIQTMLLGFLSPVQRKGIPFNHMFQMREYPAEMLPLYAQGYSVARFLIGQGGNQQFVRFLGDGMNNEGAMGTLPSWNRAIKQHYGFQDLSDLQLSWLRWVKAGSDPKVAIQFSPRKNLQMASNLVNNPNTRLANLPNSKQFQPGQSHPGQSQLGQSQVMPAQAHVVPGRDFGDLNANSPAANAIEKNFYVQRALGKTSSGSSVEDRWNGLKRPGQLGVVNKIPGRESVTGWPTSNPASAARITQQTRFANSKQSNSSSANSGGSQRTDSTISNR